MTPPTFIDFEASSLDLVASYPVEVGVCFPNGTTQSWLIKPHVLWLDWSESAQAIHGIERQLLIDEGIEITDVANALNQTLKNTVYCDAWTFDSFWLYRLFKAAHIKPLFQLESIASILAEEHIKNWQTTREQVISELEINTHRAANDALILHKTWQRLHSKDL